MQFINRFIVFSKRILTHKLYVAMLVLIIVLTAVYTFLPQTSRSADIKVALYSEESSELTEELLAGLEDIHSLYTFYTVDDIDALLRDVKSGYAECGYMIPAGFFRDYINGHQETNQIIQYTTPATSLGATINETLFSCIFKLCAGDILILGVNIDDYDAELTEGLSNYLNGDKIFRMESTTSGAFSYDTFVYKINLPVYEMCLVFLLFAGMLGLLLYQQDSERSIYIALSSSDRIGIRCISIFTSMFPILIISLLSSFIMGLSISQILHLILYSILFYVGVLLLGIIIRKSTQLTKVLPLIVLISIIYVFISTLL